MARGPVLPKAVKQTAINLYEEGASLRRVSERLGVSHECVRLWLIEVGVPIRPPHTNDGKRRVEK